MKNYDKLWKNWHQKAVLSELSEKERKKLENHIKNVMTSLGDDTKEILSRAPFNSVFGDKLRIVVPFGDDSSITLAEYMVQLHHTAEAFYREKEKKGALTNPYVLIKRKTETVEQSIDGGASSVQIDITVPTLTIRYKNKMGESRVEEYQLGRAFNKFKMKEAGEFWSKAQSYLTRDTQQMNRSIHLYDLPSELKSAKNSPQYSIVVTRSPIDVARMSDFPNIKSCHRQGGQYFICALEEARRGGAVAFVVPKQQLQQVLDAGRLQEPEIFADLEIGLKTFSKKQDPNSPMSFLDYEDDELLPDEMITPISRLRIRRIVDVQKMVEYMVPEQSEYGIQIHNFYKTLTEWCAEQQKFLFVQNGKFEFDRNSNLVLTGGSYEDTGADELLFEQMKTIIKITNASVPEEISNLIKNDSPLLRSRIRWKGIEDPNEGVSDCDLQVAQIANLAATLEMNARNPSTKIDEIPSSSICKDDTFESIRIEFQTNIVSHRRLLSDEQSSKSNFGIIEDTRKLELIERKLKELNPVTFNKLGQLEMISEVKINSYPPQNAIRLWFQKRITNQAEINSSYSFCTFASSAVEFENNVLQVLTELNFLEKSAFISPYAKQVFQKIQNNSKFISFMKDETVFSFILSSDTVGKPKLFPKMRNDQEIELPAYHLSQYKRPVLVTLPQKVASFLNKDTTGESRTLLYKLPQEVEDMIIDLYNRNNKSFDHSQQKLFREQQNSIPEKTTIRASDFQNISIKTHLIDNNIVFEFKGDVSLHDKNEQIYKVLDFINWASDNLDTILDKTKEFVIQQLRTLKRVSTLLDDDASDRPTEYDPAIPDFEELIKEFVPFFNNLYKDQLVHPLELKTSSAKTNGNQIPQLIDVYMSFFDPQTGEQIIWPQTGTVTYRKIGTIMFYITSYGNKHVVDSSLISHGRGVVTFHKRFEDQLTKDDFNNSFKEFFVDIHKYLQKESPTYFLFKPNSLQQVKETVKINRKLLKEKLITWYKRNKR